MNGLLCFISNAECDKSQKKFRLIQCRTKHSSGMKLVKISREKMSVYQASIDIRGTRLFIRKGLGT